MKISYWAGSSRRPRQKQSPIRDILSVQPGMTLQPTPQCHRLSSVESQLHALFDSLYFRRLALTRLYCLVLRRVPSGRAVCRGGGHRHLQAVGRFAAAQRALRGHSLEFGRRFAFLSQHRQRESGLSVPITGLPRSSSRSCPPIRRLSSPSRITCGGFPAPLPTTLCFHSFGDAKHRPERQRHRGNARR